jgi:large subunit ribosomal protein L13
MVMEYVIDGSDKVIGRVASSVAKLLLDENSVSVINSEKMVITGHVKDLTDKYKRLIELKDKANPEHSPYWSRRPDMFVKRVVRGMLPYKKPKGKAAFKRLRVYIGAPEELKKLKVYNVKSKMPNEIFESTMTIKQLTEKLGYDR